MEIKSVFQYAFILTHPWWITQNLTVPAILKDENYIEGWSLDQVSHTGMVFTSLILIFNPNLC
jgi:hypothetical protein